MAMSWAIEPHSLCHSTGDFTFMFTCIPVSTKETHVLGKWVVHKDAIEGVDYDLANLVKLWDATNVEDRDLCELNQRGVDSLGYRPGPYSEVAESLVERFTSYYVATALNYIAEVEDATPMPALAAE